MPTPTSSKRLLLSSFFLATGAALVGFGIWGGSHQTTSTPVLETDLLDEMPKEMHGKQLGSSLEGLEQRSKQGPVRVLVLGDSHTSSTFGRALDLLLRSRPHTEVTTVGACGHRPNGFLSGKQSRCGLLELNNEETRWSKKGSPPSVDDLVAQVAPDLTIVELGANQIHSAWRNPKAARKEIAELAGRLSARGACVWVGPPTGREREKPRKKIDHVYKLLAEALPSTCVLLDSRPESLDFLVWKDLAAKSRRRGDGRHFDSLGPIGQQAARKWALHVFRSVSPSLDAIERGTLVATRSYAHSKTRLALAD